MKKICMGVALLLALPSVATAELTLQRAVTLAIENDSWLTSNSLKEQAYRAEASSHGALPDPTLSLGVENLPTDSWALDQESMTQLKIGITQRFPNGDSRAIKVRKSQLIADQSPFQRAQRKAQLRMRVSQLWLDSYFARTSIRLIERDRYLFEQLIDVAAARYEAALGRARQQDVLHAQLALTKLEDRLARLYMDYDSRRQLMTQWLPASTHVLELPVKKPFMQMLAVNDITQIQQHIKRHPQLQISENAIDIQQLEVDLAKQHYKPGWALRTAYGYREDSANGVERADFLSLGVSVDLPLFTENRQDKTVVAARSRKEAIAIDAQLQEKQLLSLALKTISELHRLEERASLYQQRLLRQMHEQAEASLSAYTNDDGDFSEVVEAYIAELNSKIEALDIEIRRQKAQVTLQYVLAGSMSDSDSQSIANDLGVAQ